MGQRANLVIGNASGYDLFYSHWCANTLPQDLFWGPEHALEFISQQRSVTSKEGWLDTIWAEGGAVVDPQNRTLVLYGGCDLLYDVPLRRLYLDFLKVPWVDWKIQWAFEGIVDIAQYVGVDRRHIIADDVDVGEKRIALSPPQERDWLRCIGTIKHDDAVKIFPLDGDLTDYLYAGPTLISNSDGMESYSRFNVSEWTQDFPCGGFHIDRNCRRLDFWLANDCPDPTHELERIWRDWKVSWHRPI